MKYFFQHKFIIIIIFLTIFTLSFFKLFVVSGSSMKPAYSHGDVVLVEKISHHFFIQRDDILIFEHPRGDNDDIQIKRVIGLPTETVNLDDGFSMYLGSLDYFVIGDNRNESTDSRNFGTIQPEHVIGKPMFKF